MAAVPKVRVPPSEQMELQGQTLTPSLTTSDGACGDGQIAAEHVNENEEKKKTDNDGDGLSGHDGVTLSFSKEVKIDIDATSLMEDDDKAIKNFVSIPLNASATNGPSPEEFSQEKDAPEETARVYDFNMVKQKTLPRINFRNNSVFRAISSQSKMYVLVWTLMPISLVICIIILILYFMS